VPWQGRAGTTVRRQPSTRCGGACDGRSPGERRRLACRAISRRARSLWLSASITHVCHPGIRGANIRDPRDRTSVPCPGSRLSG
jgi:hypothetical protein